LFSKSQHKMLKNKFFSDKKVKRFMVGLIILLIIILNFYILNNIISSTETPDIINMNR
jgi:hypothetical protein